MGSNPTSDPGRDTTRDRTLDDTSGGAHSRDDAERAKRNGETPAALRIQHQTQWVDQQIRVAMARGDFDNLPGAGKPIVGLGSEHDKDWWLKKLIEREQITGVLPPSLQLRKDDAELDARLDRHTSEAEVRRLLEEFNARARKARYTHVDGPPLVTQPRDLDAEVAAWRARSQERSRLRREARAAHPAVPTGRRRWWRRS